MSVRDALLSLLSTGPRHGYQLKAEFDAATGSVWPLNIGQVYATLQRLEKAGLVDPAGDADGDGRQTYCLTETGHEAVDDWLLHPKTKLNAVRDETSLKILIAMAVGDLPITEVLDAQRAATMSVLQTLTAMKADGPTTTILPGTDGPGERGELLAWVLHLDRLIMMAEAEVRWLDLTESRLFEQRVDKRPPSPERQAGHEYEAELEKPKVHK